MSSLYGYGAPSTFYPDATIIPVDKGDYVAIRLACVRCLERANNPTIRPYATLDGLGEHIVSYHKERPLFFHNDNDVEHETTEEEIPDNGRESN